MVIHLLSSIFHIFSAHTASRTLLFTTMSVALQKREFDFHFKALFSIPFVNHIGKFFEQLLL